MPARSFSRLMLLTLLAPVAFATGCEDSPTAPAGQTPNPPPVTVASILVAPGAPRIILGQHTQLVALPLTANGTVVTGLTPQWSSEHPHIVEVSASGQAVGHVLGASNVTVRVGGRELTTVVHVIEIPAVAITLSVYDTTVVVGGEFVVAATVRDSLSRSLPGRAVTWLSADPSVATVSETGRVTALGLGQTTIFARHEGAVGGMRVRVTEDLGGQLRQPTWIPRP